MPEMTTRQHYNSFDAELVVAAAVVCAVAVVAVVAGKIDMVVADSIMENDILETE